MLSLTTGIPTNGQQIGEAETRILIVFQYFSKASVIASRRQMLRRERKKVHLFTNVRHQGPSILLLQSMMGNDCHSVILKRQTQGQ